MRLGIVSDIHCNVVGLQEALTVMGPVDELLCLGDCIDRAKFSNDVVGLLKSMDARIILGNHEEVFLSQPSEIRNADPTLVAFLAAQPHRRRLVYGDKSVLMIHSTPWDPRGEYIYPHNPKLERFAEAGADFVLYGHTHAAVVRRFGAVLVVNPGTAGEGRDTSTGRHLSCAVLDTETADVRLIDYLDPRFPADG